MDQPIIEFALLSFVSLFTMVNPLGTSPVFTGMTAGLDFIQVRHTALRACRTAFLILILFALAGRFIFEFFHISINSLRVVGGVIFFIMGYEMLQARLTRTQFDETTVAHYVKDIAITPLGIPMICGPGAITNVMILMNQSRSMLEKSVLFLVILAVLSITYLFLISGKKIITALGGKR